MRQVNRLKTWRWSAVTALLAVLAGAPSARAATTFTAGQAVEVRQGDSWSTATVVRREGRRYLVHCAGSDASTDQWVGPDSIRTPGGAAGAPVPATPAPTPLGGQQRTGDATADDGNGDTPPREVIPPVTPDTSAVAGERPARVPEGAWSVAADPAAKPDPVGSGRLVLAPNLSRFHVTQLLPCRDGGAIMGFADYGDKARLVAWHGTTASAKNAASLPAVSLPMAASPSGALLVCRCHKSGSGHNGRIDLYALPPTPGGPAKPVVSFEPYGTGGGGNPGDVSFAAAVSDTRIVTCEGMGRLIGWDVAAGSVTGVWRTDVGGPMHYGNDVVVSPGGHWLAAAGPGGVTFVDPVDGRVLGRVDTAAASTDPVYDLACAPSGGTIMARGGGPGQDQFLVTIDVAAGRVTGTVLLPLGDRWHPDVGALACVDDRFALLNGRTLVDATTGAAVPSYRPARSMFAPLAATGAGVTLIATDTRLSAQHVPNDAVRDAAVSGADLALRPGMTVALDLRLDGLTDDQKSTVESAVRKQLADDKFVLADQADATVVVRTEPGESHQRSYGRTSVGVPMFLSPGGSSTSMTLTDKVTRVTITQGGRTVWERKSVSTAPYSFPLKEGQSLEDGANAAIKYDPQFLISLTIPAYIAKPAPPPDAAGHGVPVRPGT
jgi:hypothetical protein